MVKGFRFLIPQDISNIENQVKDRAHNHTEITQLKSY